MNTNERELAREQASQQVIRLLRRSHMLDAEVAEIRKSIDECQRQAAASRNNLRFRRWNRVSAQSEDGDPMTEATQRIEEWYARRMGEYTRRLDTMNECRGRVLELMTDLPDDQAVIMRMRYLEGKSWNQIARAAYLSERQGQRLQKRAIALMTDRLLELELTRNLAAETCARVVSWWQ